ncbi:MAG: hypothetical protein HYY06_30155 [Deltaproteobacteria bacterium]|nr:hypothetical protein [Deltaproteobacteria bacterium]
MRASSLRLLSVFALLVPVVGGAKGGGCGGAARSRSPAPDVTGAWAIEYDDTLGVEIRIGGAVYTDEIGAQGGSVTIDHEGQPLTFDLDCERPEVVCPSEAWPDEVTAEQRLAEYPHQMIVTLPTQTCSGQLVEPDPADCGEGTPNPDCDQVCDGEVATTSREVFGVIAEDGSSFDLLLGAGIASNGFNCVLLGISVAQADLVNTGSAEGGDWRSTRMDNGAVTTGYAGGCLWVGDPDADQELEALVLGASIEFTTGFTGTRL